MNDELYSEWTRIPPDDIKIYDHPLLWRRNLLTQRNKTVIKRLRHMGRRQMPLQKPLPCNFDHNGDCLVCDCWPSNCAYKRYIAGDYSYESKVQLECMFKEYQKALD